MLLCWDLGGGIIPTWLDANTKCSIDVVEKIPELETISHNYFNMPKTVNVILDDGFKFVETTKKKYDIIITDLIQPSEINIYDETFYNNLSKRLTPNGYVAINYFAWKDTPEWAQHICDFKEHLRTRHRTQQPLSQEQQLYHALHQRDTHQRS